MYTVMYTFLNMY